MNAPQPKSSTHRKEQTAAESGLLLYPENPVLCRLGDSEFDYCFGWNLDLLLRLGIKAGASLPFLLYQLAKTRQDEFAVLFNLFVCERAERIEEYSSGCFVGLGGSRQCDLKFCLGHLYGLWQCYYTISRESLTVSFPGSQSSSTCSTARISPMNVDLVLAHLVEEMIQRAQARICAQ